MQQDISKGAAPSLRLTGKCLEVHSAFPVDRVEPLKWPTFEFLSKSTDLYLCMSTRTHRIHCAPVPSTSCPFTPPLCNKICCTGISSWTKLPLWPGNIKPIPHVYSTTSGPPASTRQTPLKIQAICTHRKQTSGAFPNKSACCKGTAQAFFPP